MWRFLGLMVIALGITGVILWSTGNLPFLQAKAESKRTNPSDDVAINPSRVVTPIAPAGAVGSTVPLYSAAANPDMVTIPDTVLNAVNETEIGSQIDGKVAEMNVRLGDWVENDKVLMKLNDRVAQRAIERQQRKFDSGTFKINSAKALWEYYVGERQRVMNLKDAATPVERRSADARVVQGENDYNLAKDEKVIDELDLMKLKEEVKYHEIRSNREGRIDKIYNNKKAGEVVKSGEPLFRVVRDDRLRAEGAVDTHLAPYLKVGMNALVEPERQLPAFRTLHEHTNAVTDIAVTPDGRFLASASKDQSVILSDWMAPDRRVTLLRAPEQFPEEVYAVACGSATKPDAEGQMTYIFATGCSHGRAFLWRVTVDKNGKVVDKKFEELRERIGQTSKSPHGASQPVRSVAFDPDGVYCATGGDDYQICIWKVEGAELLCRVRETTGVSDRAHRGAVTSLAFMKDGQLISVGSTDKTIKRWKLGQDANAHWSAELVKVQKDRAAQVTRLGPTADGGWMLFDYGDELRILDAASDWNRLGALRNPRPGPFQNIAMLSPAGQMALTVSAGRLQLWALRDPKLGGAGGAGDRSLSGYECRQLMTSDPSKITCAAFHVPRELGGLGGKTTGADLAFAFTGSEDGVVQIWQLPPDQERTQPLLATITYVSPQVERGSAGLLQVRAELDNPTDARRLKIGQRVNLTVFPEGAGK